MVTTSVSQLLSWKHCHRQHHFQYVDRLEQLNRPIILASGTTVHKTLEAVVRGETTIEDSEKYAESYLREELVGRENIETTVKKYLPGILNAVSKAPDWMKKGEWYVEERIELDLGNGHTIFGYPDMYRVYDNQIDLVEIKTTDTSPLHFLLYNPQHRYYGLILNSLYPEHLIQFVYVCLPTQGRSSKHTPWVFSQKAIDTTRQEVLQLVEAVGEDANPNYSRGCNYCDYEEICAGIITGSSGRGVIEEKFSRRV